MMINDLQGTSTAAVTASVTAALLCAGFIALVKGIPSAKRWYLDTGIDRRVKAKALILTGFTGLSNSSIGDKAMEEAASSLLAGLDEWRSLERSTALVSGITYGLIIAVITAFASSVAAWLLSHPFRHDRACEILLAVFAISFVVSIGCAMPFAVKLLSHDLPKKDA